MTHSDDLAVDRFAAAMKAKLSKKRSEGRSGWDNRNECTAEYLSYLLIQHIIKGDPLDVGNLAMMLHQRGDHIVIDDETRSIATALSQPHPADERVVEALNAVAALVELVCDETLGPSVEDEPDNESVGSNMMGPVPMTFGHVREARDAVAILRAALAQEGRNG